MSRISVVAGLALTVLLLVPAGRAEARNPTDELKAHVRQVLDLLRSRRQDRRAAMRHAVEAVLDVPAMAERALGRYWAARTPEERTEFVRVSATRPTPP
ncbi:MAG: ABC transporter substrate-binding protein [Candidatus Rokubacteria bacterium]|nr:ABC transporter substrate-binding protein [Candidatus Rokubacteria bacterium]